MIAPVLLNLLNELRKRDEMRRSSSIFATSLINSIIQERSCNILLSFTQRYNGRHYVTLRKSVTSSRVIRLFLAHPLDVIRPIRSS